MTVIAIPTLTDTPHWDQITTLDGIDFQLGFRYNQRENVYYLIIADTTGNILNGGIKLVSNWRLLTDFVDPAMPPGELVVFTTGPDDSPPGFGELGIGQRGTLYYADRATTQSLNQDLNRDPIAAFDRAVPSILSASP